MFTYLKKPRYEPDRLDKLFGVNNFLWNWVIPVWITIMGTVGFGMFALLVILAVTGKF